MKLKDVNAEVVFELWVEPVLTDEKICLGVGQIQPSDSKNEYNLITTNKFQKITLLDSSTGIDLNFHLKRGCAHLAEIEQTAKDDRSALLKVFFFNGDIVEIGNIEVGIDERIEATAKRNGILFRDAEGLAAHLFEKCTISVGSDKFFLMLTGPAANSDFESEDLAGSAATINREKFSSKQYREFSIYGDRLRIPVAKRNIDKSKDIHFATKIVFKDRQNKEGALRLARGHISFLDYTKTGRIRALAAGAMSQLTKETGSYLKRWDEYGVVEGEMFLKKAKSIGAISHNGKPEKTYRGVKFFVSNPISIDLTLDDSIELTDTLPPYVTNSELTWGQYSQLIEDSCKELNQKDRIENNTDPPDSDNLSIQILDIQNGSIELKLDMVPTSGKYIVWSTRGEKTQIERRMKARSAILEGRSANPLLGLLIEEGGTLPDIQRVTKLLPLTPFVKDKIFKNPPTKKQEEAISVSLNTPDIALIQGPPGTGKTTVITAILERLNQEYDKTKSIRGQILVSGFQHDAVENIVSRLSVNALPAVKFGKRSSSSEFTEDVVTERMNQWCSSISENIRKKNPQIVQSEDQVKLSELFVAYSLCPSSSNTRNLLKRIHGLPRNVISENLISKSENLMKSIESEVISFDPTTLRLIRSLRISEKGFIDDGPSRASDLLERIEGDINDSDIKTLEKACRWRFDKELDFLDEMKRLKENLLIRYLPEPDFRMEKPRADILRLVAEVSKQLKSTMSSKNKRDSLLAEFLHELEDNPDGVRESVEDYNFIFAATTQQSEGTAIRRAKQKFNDKEIVQYDTVIIDEAARTSPRDLLIPMSQAVKRIILVGDHRQLPHIIDEDVVTAVEEKFGDKDKSESDYVRESMFAYLFRRLKALEEKDHIQRTVTLDAQYRTHPLLGNFASDNFYKKHKEDYRSPLPGKHFAQNLDGIQGCSAVWIDVPYSNSEGNGEKSGFSRKRKLEARKIAEKLSKWIKSEAGKGLSFGVISFYKAQVSTVYSELQEFGITEKSQDGIWQLNEDYRFLANGEEQLRIGTVDAFQGMEFDIVFLSTVRIQNLRSLETRMGKEKDYQKIKQGVFGHLMSENRLCVSMSRQKRVLAMVGDVCLFKSKIAIDAVPALKNYYDLCSEKGVVL